MGFLMWGTGRLTGKVLDRYVPLDTIDGFIDNDRSKVTFLGKPVISPEEAKALAYDAILVVNSFGREIYHQCQELDIDLSKVIFVYSNCYVQDFNQDYGFVEQVLGEKFARVIRDRYRIMRQTVSEDELCLQNWENMQSGGVPYLDTDPVRMKCFELAVKEIRKKNLRGNVAEAGVFRGEFAQFLNYAFPDKKLYLFDTFDGFEINESIHEIKNGHATRAFVEAYRGTNIARVIQRMRYLDQVILKQGFFPDSLQGLEDQFSFVSLDLDFEASIYEGLAYFYPRLESGGYIFVHDYNSDLRGVERAVDRFECEKQVSLCKVPLCDANGTLVITK